MALTCFGTVLHKLSTNSITNAKGMYCAFPSVIFDQLHDLLSVTYSSISKKVEVARKCKVSRSAQYILDRLIYFCASHVSIEG